MNVVHVFPYAAAVPGGHSNAIRSFIGSQRNAGINAVGITPKADDRATESSSAFPLAEVDSVGDLRWGMIASRFEIGRDSSLLNFHTITRMLGPLQRDLRGAGVPYVVTSHGQFGFQNTWHWLKKFIYLNLIDSGPARAAGIQVLTHRAARQFRRLVPAFRGELVVQANLIAAPGPAGSLTAARDEYGIPADAFVVLYLGRLDVCIKGLDLVVRAFARLPFDQARLVLVGPDWKEGKAELQRLAQKLGCVGRVCFPGPVYGDRKWALLRMADVFVSPSRREAFSIAQAEAMMAGLPIVTSTRVNLAEDLRAAGAAVVVPPTADRLARAIMGIEGGAAQRAELAARGRDWVMKNCDPVRAGSQFVSFYQTILDRRGNARS